MSGLGDIYRQLSRPWTSTELDDRYRAAERRGAELIGRALDVPERPIAQLAAAIPPAATLSTAIDVLHAFPGGQFDSQAGELVATAETSAARTLHRCHRALELDGARQGYTADEWLAAVVDLAAPVLPSLNREQQPPVIVLQTQESISWLSRAIVDLDEDSAESASALTEVLARLLVVWLFLTGAQAGLG